MASCTGSMPTSGTLVRSIATGNPVDGFDIVAPPLVTDRLVIVAGSGDDRVGPLKFLAFDKATGEPASEAELGELEGLSAAVRQPGVFDAERGQVLWPFTFPAIAVSEIERRAWAGNGIVALDVATGALRWSHRELPPDDALPQDGPVHLLPASGDLPPRLLQFRGDGRVTLLDAASGTPLSDASIYGAAATRIAFSSGTHNGDLRIAAPTVTCENAWAVNGYASTVDVASGLAYGANATACVTGVGHILTEQRGSNWLGAYYAGHDASLGVLTAVDIASGEIAAQRLFPRAAGRRCDDHRRRARCRDQRRRHALCSERHDARADRRPTVRGAILGRATAHQCRRAGSPRRCDRRRRAEPLSRLSLARPVDVGRAAGARCHGVAGAMKLALVLAAALLMAAPAERRRYRLGPQARRACRRAASMASSTTPAVAMAARRPSRFPALPILPTCAAEPTGWHEVYFRYDDEADSLREASAALALARLEGTRVYGFRAMLSALFDETGTLVGLRILADPRGVPGGERNDQWRLAAVLQQHFSDATWTCEDAELRPRETMAASFFVKRTCTGASEGRELALAQNYFHKAGQAFVDTFGKVQDTYFVSDSRFEVRVADGN